MSDEQTNQSSIMKELSDIKASLAVNTNETANIKQRVTELQVDIKEIKNDFINRREFRDGLDEVYAQLAPLKKFVYGLVAAVGIALVTAVIRYFVR